jgi:hypothetical protein
MEFMNPYYRHFLLLRQLFFAIALEVFDRKGGSAEVCGISSIDGGSFFGKQHPMAKNNSDEPRTLEIRKYQNRRYYDGTCSSVQFV